MIEAILTIIIGWLLISTLAYQWLITSKVVRENDANGVHRPSWLVGYWRFITIRYYRNGKFLFRKDAWRD